MIAIDDRTAVVTTLFDYPDRAVEGRQSQTWVRFADGWRVVAAHVSELQRATVALAVVAAHRTGQPLHPELVTLGARFSGVTRTAPVYRLVALPGPGVPRGGLVAVGAGGHAIEVELHEVPTVGVGALLAAAACAAGARAGATARGRGHGRGVRQRARGGGGRERMGQLARLPRGRGGRCRVRVA